MLHFCPGCRNSDIEKQILDSEDGHATAECPECSERFEFRYLPLYSLEGAPGVGKSTTAGLLEGEISPTVYEGDLHIDLTNENLSWGTICDLDFRVCMTLHAAGRQALFVGGVHPHQLADSPETRYFSSIERCTLVCDDADLEERLRERSMAQDDIDFMLDVNRWYRDGGTDHGIEVVNTSDLAPDEVARQVREWLENSEQ
ncbi:hypothetical protein A4G99_08845 [Haladaptatus sp. R4]|uniref:hypothetical protein n=1 Tax=Haladaptatus sp. R4 TaxID=1679489 RepID=UPI0007B4BC1E|nr:hypothetical protein [Haladaptatus sp. R4]KZN24482.1 hypothetical protein A4G99_08845 [Haladaptatus sp. R4]